MPELDASDHRIDQGWDSLRLIHLLGKPTVFLVCLAPLAIAIARIVGGLGGLGANPIEALQDHFGIWGLRFILITLAVTPLRRLTGYNWLLRFRRMLGLFGFFYVLAHFSVYLILDQSLSLGYIIEDIVERPFITLGMIALLFLIPLAATSTNSMRRRLGRNWQKLHNSIYLIGILGVWHFWWQVKKDIAEPAFYAAILATLLGMRLWFRYRRR